MISCFASGGWNLGGLNITIECTRESIVETYICLSETPRVIQKCCPSNGLPWLLLPYLVELYFNFSHLIYENNSVTVNDSDLNSVTLKAYKVKDCGRNLGSDDCI